jgi:hypothetical protein
VRCVFTEHSMNDHDRYLLCVTDVGEM